MPVKARTAKARRRQFSDEALALFVELEAVPMRRRDAPEWQAASHRLAEMLGLVDEWFCSGCDVLDCSARPCHPPGYTSYDDWFKVRAVRELLLEAIGLGDRQAAP
jgi:hypothetical protein